jgi:transcriptional regulator
VYLPQQFEETDISVLHALIRANPLGAWVTLAGDGLVANHLPFLLDPADGAHGTLRGHVARPNLVWQALSGNAPAVVMFQGAAAYITPSWYPAKQEHGKVVPTWNYAVVHAHGRPRAVQDRDWLLRHVSALTAQQEAGQARPWQVTDAPPDYIERMLGGIVGIEIPLERLEGKWKVSQNRAEADRRGVVEGLLARGDEASRTMSGLVSATLKDNP